MALLVIGIQHQLGSYWIVAVGCDGAVHHVIFRVNLQVACLVPPFQQRRKINTTTLWLTTSTFFAR
jgi:hypothetical protein